MQPFKKLISGFLLLVFTWVVLPPSFVHECFADHKDTECLVHSHDVQQLEPVHKHCDVFKTVTPLYDIPTFTRIEKPLRVVIAECVTVSNTIYYAVSNDTSQSRGPPSVS